MCEGAWVRLPEIAAIISEHRSVRACSCFIYPDAVSGKPRIGAEVDSEDASLTPEALRRHALSLLDRSGSKVVPHWYAIRGAMSAAAGGAPPSGRLVGAGSGHRADEATVQAGEKATVLRDCVGPAVSEQGVHMGLSYIAGGGQIRRIPGVIRAITARGYDGLSFRDFLTPRSLLELAAQMSPAANDGSQPSDVPARCW